MARRSGGGGRRRDGGRRPTGNQAKRRRGPAAYFWGAGGLLAIALASALVLLVVPDSGDGKPPRAKVTPGKTSGRYPTAYSESPSTEAFAAITNRNADSTPLTSEEAFGGQAKSLSDPKTRLELRDSRLDGNCANAVWGTGLVQRLSRGGCKQVARAIYADKALRYAATVVIFNLANVNSANGLVSSLRQETGEGFALPLSSPPPLDRFGQGFTTARGLAMGHYAVVSWVQRLDGTGDEEDTTLLSLLVSAGKPEGVLRRVSAPR